MRIQLNAHSAAALSLLVTARSSAASLFDPPRPGGCGVVMSPTLSGAGAPGRSGRGEADVQNLPPACDVANRVTVTLPSGATKAFSKTAAANGKTFHGESADGSSFQYIRAVGAGDKIVGSLVDLEANTVSQFSVDGDGNQVVEVTNSNDFPPELDPMDHHRGLQEEEEMPEDSVSPPVSSLRAGQGTRSLSDNGDVLDVMVVWTAYAECRRSAYARGCTRTATTRTNMLNLIDLAVAESNTAYSLSGVNTQLNLVYAEFIDYAEDRGFSAALNDITGTADGYMDQVHAIRTQVGADLVALIIDDPQYCGIAWMGPNKLNMFSVTAYNCATGYYSFSHEIGHNMGCHHDRGTVGTCTSTNYNFGWRDPQSRFRSILAYNCASGQCDNNQGGGCNRVQRFSNPTLVYNGYAIGNAQNDNARVINNNRATVAAYYTHVSTGPVTASPTKAPVTVTASPTKAPVTASPTKAPVTARPTTPPVPTTANPTRAPVCAFCSATNAPCCGQCVTGGNPSNRGCFAAPPPTTNPPPSPPTGGCSNSNCSACTSGTDCKNVQCTWSKGSCA